ncbi:hypothetical protein Tco_0186885, partial [Tanacetum coccineum]
MVPRAVLMKTGLKAVNTTRLLLVLIPKLHFIVLDQCHIFLNQHNQLQKAINTARTNSTVVNAVRANQVNAVKASLPRKNNMYNVDMKNIIPKESLTCLVAK